MKLKPKRYITPIAYRAESAEALTTHEWIKERIEAVKTSTDFPDMEVCKQTTSLASKIQKPVSIISAINAIAAILLPVSNAIGIIEIGWVIAFAPVWGPLAAAIALIGMLLLYFMVKNITDR